MTACDGIKRRLSAYLDGEVPLPERVAIDEHLATCAGCHGLREELARANQLVASAPEPTWAAGSTDALVGRLRAELARDVADARKRSQAPQIPPAHVIAARPWMHGWRGAALSLAAVFLVVAVPGMWMSLGLQRAAAPADVQVARAPQASVAAPAAPVIAAELPAQDAQDKAGQDRAGQDRADQDKAAGAKAAQPPVVQEPSTQLAATRGLEAADPMVQGKAEALASVAKPAGSTSNGVSAAPLSGLEAEIAAIEARMAAVESSVSQFTTAAREQARRESSQIASRRYEAWR